MSADAFYGSWVEFGHYSRPPGKHAIRRRSSGPQRFKGTKMVGEGKIKKIAGRKFLTIAFESNKARAYVAMEHAMRDEFAKLKI